MQAAEPDEGRLLLEPSQEFWSLDADARYRAAAQIVFTMGNLEEGREVTLIDGLRPGRIERPNGKQIDQPLTREDFDPPLVQVVQPVAGAVVADPIPISLTLTRKRPVSVSLEVAEETVASTIIHSGTGELPANDAAEGEAVLEIEIEPQLTIEVPISLPPRS